MERGKSNLIIGLGVGSVVGALVYTVNDKVLDAGVEVADKVADGTFHIAEKADDVRNKVHTFSDKAKK